MHRNYHMDNAKFWLVCLLVIVHFISPGGGDLTIDSVFTKDIFISLMLFIVPAFVMVSGFFSKADLSKEDMKKLIINLLIPYLFFETLFLLDSKNQHATPYLEPLYYLWYLPSLFAWRLLLPVFANFKFPILLALFIAVVVGYSSQVGYFLTLSRIFYFFPYFLIGYYMKDRIHFEVTNLLKIVSWITLCLIGTAIFIWFSTSSFPAQKWILGSYSYAALGCTDWMCGLIRLALYPITLITIFSFLCIIPKNKTLFSDFGSRSIYPYLLQGLVIFLVLKLGVYNQPSFLTQVLLIPAGFLCTLLLSTVACTKIFKWVIQPDYLAKILFK